MLLWWLLSTIVAKAGAVVVRMSEPSLTVYDNGNLTLTCRTAPSASTNGTALSVRARMALTLMPIPRGPPLHQMNGVLHCDPMRTNCDAEFNVEVSCITSRINHTRPFTSVTLETACQVVDDLVCSYDWMRQHKNDCYALGSVTIHKGPKLGEPCSVANETSGARRYLPCGEHQYCNHNTGVCECVQYSARIDKCVSTHGHESGSLNLLSSTTESTLSPELPTKVSEEPQLKKTGSAKGASKTLVIFLLIIAILLCIALAVVVVWSYSRNRRRAMAAGAD